MSVQSSVAPFAENPVNGEVEPLIDAFDFENTDAVLIDAEAEFDNFTIDLSKLPPGTKYIKFWRG